MVIFTVFDSENFPQDSRLFLLLLNNTLSIILFMVIRHLIEVHSNNEGKPAEAASVSTRFMLIFS